MTRRREMIYNILKNSKGHMTAEEVFEAAKKQMPGIVRATIYNNLNAIVSQNMIMRIKTPEGSDIFDKTMRLHGHAICEKCGKVRDINIGDLKGEIEKDLHRKIDSYNLTVYYVCDECVKNSDKNAENLSKKEKSYEH